MQKEVEKKQKLDTQYNLRIYWEFLSKYKLLFVLVIVLVVVSEAINLSEKFFFKIVIDKGGAFASGALKSNLFVHILITIAIAYGSLIVLKTVLYWFRLHLINILESKVIFDIKKRFFNHIVTLSYNFHTTHKTGSLIARLLRGSGAAERMTDFLVFNTFPVFFQIIMTAVSLSYFDGVSAIIVVITAITFIGYGFLFQIIQKESNDILNKNEDIEKANVSDMFMNIDSIKYYGRETYIKNKFNNLSAINRDSLVKYWNYFRWSDAGQSAILTLGTFFLMFFSIRSFLAGRITLGTLTFVYTIYGSLFGNLYGLLHGIRNYYRSIIDFNDLFQYGKIEQDVKDRDNAEVLKINEGSVEFKDVSFKYNIRNIFNEFNLKINPGEKVALVGHSGSGKTTLVKLLYRLYDVASGQITVDGKDIRDLKQESLRGELSIVPQECILFDDTIYNNIKFSKPDATKQEVMQAIKSAQLDKIISSFPYKENTIVGERGVKLSGGEKQRVSIARAILANRKILVLDEATSALDSETEHEIQKDLIQLMEGRTSIIIAHRLSTIMHADKIVVLEKGKIVQIGNHSELIAKPGQYSNLWNLQKGGYIKT